MRKIELFVIENVSLPSWWKVVCVIFAQLNSVLCAIFNTNLNCGRMWAFLLYIYIIHEMVSNKFCSKPYLESHKLLI